MAHAEVQGKAAYNKSSSAGSTASVATNAAVRGDAAEELLAKSPIWKDYQSYVVDGEDFSAL